VDADDGRRPAAPAGGTTGAARGARLARHGLRRARRGPVARPAGTSDEDSDTTVDAQGAQHPGAPTLPTGDQAG
jgi:hypothetical protein